MKRFLWFSFLLGLVFLGGCTTQDEIDELKYQNYQLQQQISEIQFQKDAAETAAQETANFEKNLKCQERWDELKKQYNNVFSVYYNEYANTCYVRYYDKKNNNQLIEWPIDWFGPIIKETPLPYWSYTIKVGVNFRTSPSTQWNIIQKIDPTNVVTIISSVYDSSDSLWYYINFENMYWYVSSIAFK